MREVEELARPLVKGIDNAKAEGRKPPTVIIVTTQGPGTSRDLIEAIEKALHSVSGRELKNGRDFYFVHAPSNIDPGRNWANSLTKTPQPLGAADEASLERGLHLFEAYGQ